MEGNQKGTREEQDIISWEEQKAIETVKKAFQKKEVSECHKKNSAHSLTFKNYNQIWEANKSIINSRTRYDKTNKSLAVINNTGLWICQLIISIISIVPFLALCSISYIVITNFSLWNFFMGFVTLIGITIIVKLIVWVLSFLVIVGTDGIDQKDNFSNKYTISEISSK